QSWDSDNFQGQIWAIARVLIGRNDEPPTGRLEAIAGNLAAMRQRIEQLAAGQATSPSCTRPSRRFVIRSVQLRSDLPHAPASKPMPTTAPPTRSSTLPR